MNAARPGYPDAKIATPKPPELRVHLRLQLPPMPIELAVRGFAHEPPDEVAEAYLPAPGGPCVDVGDLSNQEIDEVIEHWAHEFRALCAGRRGPRIDRP
jgi:hypothetical protein